MNERQKPAELTNYRAYIKSGYWEGRKRQFFEKHARVCKICGSVEGVELNHIKYGNYGSERDVDLVALCREHHQALHDAIGVRGNMHYATEYFLESEIKKYDAEHESPHSVSVPAQSAQSHSSVATFFDKTAGMIRKLYRK